MPALLDAHPLHTRARGRGSRRVAERHEIGLTADVRDGLIRHLLAYPEPGEIHLHGGPYSAQILVVCERDAPAALIATGGVRRTSFQGDQLTGLLALPHVALTRAQLERAMGLSGTTARITLRLDPTDPERVLLYMGGSPLAVDRDGIVWP